MTEHPAEEVVRQLRAAQAAPVGRVLEQRLARLGVGEVVVDVQAAAGAVAERLGHVRRDRPVLLGELRRRHLEEGDAVGGGQGVGVLKVDLELGVGVLVVGLVDAPAELVQDRRHLLQVRHCRGH